MALEESILKSTKKMLGLDDAYKAFDLDVITHINSTFFTLNQLGLGPTEGFMIEGDSETWDEFIDDVLNYNAVKSYVYLKVRMLFDPPGTSYHINALEEQIKELEHRLVTERDLTKWQAPGGAPVLP